MKSLLTHAAHAGLLTLLCLSVPCAARGRSAQGEASAPHLPPAQSAARTPRERRALAYAKLLEGQRYYAAARSGALAADALRHAQQAFQLSAALDPTLAEAHTALAEIAFFFFDDWPQAEREGAAATQANPDSLGAHRILSRVYTVRSKLAEGPLNREAAELALAELKQVLRLSPADAEAWALLAELHLASGRDNEAIEALRTWASLPAAAESRFYQVVTGGRELTPAAAHARLAEALLHAGRADEAVIAVRRALSLEPTSGRYLELLGEALEASGSTDQRVIDELSALVAQNPQNAVASGMLARVEARAKRVDEAAATLRAAVRAANGNEQNQLALRLQLAQTYADAGRYDEAIAVHEELLSARGIGAVPLTSTQDRQLAAIVLGSILSLQQQAGQGEKALATVERMRRLLGDDDPTPDIQRVNLLRMQGRRPEALEAVRAARQRFPEDERLFRLEAYTLTELGRVEEALALVRPRLKGTAEDYAQHLLMASLLLNAGRGGEAVEAARKALDLAGEEAPERAAQALLLLSSAQERAGDFKGSEASLRRVLASDPNNTTALNNLGYFLAERNERLTEALQLVQRAVRSEPSNASFLDSLGWVYFKLGQLREAEQYLSDAARRNPASATIQEHLGDLQQRLGRTAQARTAWQKALSLSTEGASASRLKAKLNGQ